MSNPPKTVITPLGLRAPELIISGEINSTIDIWAFGCLVFELVTGRRLYYVDYYDNPEDETDDHLLMLSDTLGPLPESLYTLWTRSSRYYTSERVQYNTLLYDDPEETDLLLNKMKPLEEFFDECKPDDLSDEESNMIKALMRRILQYDPAKRPTPSQILQDPWFEDLTK
jgi:serine/threonine protein kinase